MTSNVVNELECHKNSKTVSLGAVDSFKISIRYLFSSLYICFVCLRCKVIGKTNIHVFHIVLNFRAYEHVYNLLSYTFLPLFHQSEHVSCCILLWKSWLKPLVNCKPGIMDMILVFPSLLNETSN